MARHGIAVVFRGLDAVISGYQKIRFIHESMCLLPDRILHVNICLAAGDIEQLDSSQASTVGAIMGYSFGTDSKVELMGVHPDLVAIAHAAIAISDQDFGVHDGLRTLVEQKKLFAKGASKTLDSKHLAQADGYSHAIDLVPYINGKLRWEWGPIYYIAEAVHTVAQELGVALKWGGVWDRSFNELPGSREELEDEVKAYVQRRQDEGKQAFIDGPHYQLA